MRKNKLTHLLEPSLRLYFVFLLLFAAVSAPVSYTHLTLPTTPYV